MNRAILIVICDFVVSAMLSLSTGTHSGQPAGTGGTALDNRTAAVVLQELRKEQLRLETARKALKEAQFQQGFDAARESQLKELADQLAQYKTRSEILERKLTLTRETTGALSPEQLQKQLEQEIHRRHLTNQKQLDTQRELQHITAEYANLRRQLSDKQLELGKNRAIIEERDKALKTGAEQLSETSKALQSTRSALAVSQSKVTELGKINREHLTRRQEFESALSFTRGRLSATERELAESQSRFARAQKTVAQRELELTEARRKLANMQSMLKKAVTDLSQTKADLKNTQAKVEDAGMKLVEAEKTAATVAGELKTARTKLADAEEKLRSDVLLRYTDSVMKLKLKMTESRMLIPVRTNYDLFLPLVELGGKTCVIGDFRQLTGNVRQRLDFDGLRNLSYSAAMPEDTAQGKAVTGPLYAPRRESRVGLLEVKESAGRTPLKVISLSQLKARGIQELYLFKASAFGKESCSLEGRVSVDFSDGKEYLYVRNNPRGTSEMRAEPGDFILTKQGEFVAVAVKVDNPDFGRRQETRCVVFPDSFNWNDVFVMPFSSSAVFARTAKPVLNDIQRRENR